MSGNFCTHCGNAISPMAAACPQCGHPNGNQSSGANSAPTGTANPSPSFSQVAVGPVKSRVAAGVLAIVLGAFGVHKFYLGKIGLGILYLVFCWAWIPGFVALIEGIIYLTQTDEDFAAKQGVRVS